MRDNRITVLAWATGWASLSEWASPTVGREGSILARPVAARSGK
jgi:hypothetical protein